MVLDDYQYEAIEKLKTGSVLCGGTGSGKSRTSLAYFYYKVCGGDKDCIGVRDNPIPLVIITTAKKRDGKEWDHECLLCNLDPDDYVVDSWNNIKKYTDVEDSFFIFDEQRVVGKGTWVKSFLKIARNNDWILLSATPGDTYEDYIPLFIANGFYRCRTEFIREHIVYKIGPKYPVIDRYINTGILNKHIHDIIVKLPYNNIHEHVYTTVLCGYNKELYKKTIKEEWNYDKNEPFKSASELCIALRKITNTDPSRIVNMLSILKDHPKAIIFYSFNYELELIAEALREHDIPYSEWNGHKHEAILYDEKRWVYLVQYSAGAEGWECTQTDTIIFYSQQYSYRMFVQSAGRVDRRNTPYSTLYYYVLKSRASIDLQISRAMDAKEDFNARCFSTK